MLTALRVCALLVLACVILIPYERTCIEVLAGACYWCLQLLAALQVGDACCCLVACYWCLLLVLAALQALLACVVLIPYERTRIEVLAGACCITDLACLCDTDTL